MLTVVTEEQRRIRKLDIEQEKRLQEEENEEARKNHGFTQTYPLGWRRIVKLAKTHPQAVELYAFFAENIDPTCGAVVADQQFLANKMGVTRRTISTWLKHLEECKAIVRIPVAGKVCAYALNPYEVWKGYNTSKDYAAFNTKTLVNLDGDIKRRIMSMFDGKDSNRQKSVSGQSV
jgi:hypothetical protein